MPRAEPYIIENPSDPRHPFGFEVDLKDALQGNWVGPSTSSTTISRTWSPAWSGGDFDFAMNGLEVLPEYQEQVLFTRPYYVYQLQTRRPRDEKRFTTSRS